MFLKPREGARLLDPVHKRPLPPEGAHVPDIGFWHRHVIRGDAFEVEPPAEPPAAPEPAAPASQAQE